MLSMSMMIIMINMQHTALGDNDVLQYISGLPLFDIFWLWKEYGICQYQATMQLTTNH